MDREAFELARFETRWRAIMGVEAPGWGEDAPLSPCAVDLDPQIEGVERGGACVHLVLALLTQSCLCADALGASEQAEFVTQLASIWCVGSLDTGGESSEAREGAALARFVEYCNAESSSGRHLLVAPVRLKGAVVRAFEELDGHAGARVATFENPLQIHEAFSAPCVGIEARALFVESDDREIESLIRAFGSAWALAHHEPGARSGEARELESGRVIEDRYEIARRIGAGGFATVYEARDRKVDRRVAIKVIALDRALHEAQRADFVRRFEREAKLAARVKHPCIVEVYDVGVIDDEHTPYMVMERLDGWDLEQHLRRHGPMPPGRIIPLFIQALEGIGCAHEAGIVHKDLKPSNIFLRHPDTRHEGLCVLDFGVARQEGTDTARLTRTDSAFGTPHYMAPEYSTHQITSAGARRLPDGSDSGRGAHGRAGGHAPGPDGGDVPARAWRSVDPACAHGGADRTGTQARARA